MAVNLFGANNAWVFFMAGVLVVSGMFILLARKMACQDNEKQEKRRIDMLVKIIITLGAMGAMGFLLFHFMRPFLSRKSF